MVVIHYYKVHVATLNNSHVLQRNTIISKNYFHEVKHTAVFAKPKLVSSVCCIYINLQLEILSDLLVYFSLHLRSKMMETM